MGSRIIDWGEMPTRATNVGEVRDYFRSRTATLDELEMRYIRHVLERVEGNKRRAAALLGIGRRTLYRRLGEQERDED